MGEPAANENEMTVQKDALGFIWKHVSRIGNCMLVTQDRDSLRGRPMRGIARQAENAIWFLTSKKSHKDIEIAHDNQVCVTYSDPSSNTFISLSGLIEMSDAEAQIRALWNPGAEAYFSGGPTDPDILVLKFVPAFGEYWDSPPNPVIIAIQFIKAKIAGEKVKLGENVKTAMS